MLIIVMNEKDHRLDDYFTKYNELVINNVKLFVEYHTAEDICQEAFIRLGLRLDNVKPECVAGWLLQVSERLAVDFLRKGGKYKTYVGLEIDDETLYDIYADPGHIVVEKEDAKEHRIVLERLKKEKPQWFDVLFMSFYEGMDNRAIALELGIKPSLVSKWKERAIKWLRKAYEKEYEERDR